MHLKTSRAFPVLVCISKGVYLYPTPQNSLLYLSYKWYCVRIYTAFVSTRGQRPSSDPQMRNLAALERQVPALTGRVQELRKGTDSKASSPERICSGGKVQSCCRAAAVGSVKQGQSLEDTGDNEMHGAGRQCHSQAVWKLCCVSEHS